MKYVKNIASYAAWIAGGLIVGAVMASVVYFILA